jgi:hypothetical protein
MALSVECRRGGQDLRAYFAWLGRDAVVWRRERSGLVYGVRSARGVALRELGGRMSRIRTIKPEFWSSEQVMECSMNARLMFIGLWNFCDDLGRHSCSPKTIKAEIFPGDNLPSENINGMLHELSENGLITIYSADNKQILQVTGWHHQRIDHPQKARLPGQFDDDSGNSSGNDPGTLAPESSRVESILEEDSKGRESSRVDARAGALPNSTRKSSKKSILENQTPNSEQIADAEKYGINTHEAIEAEFEHFRDYNLAKGSQLSDWNAAWRNWLAKTDEYAPRKQAVTKANGHSKHSAQASSRIFIEVGTPQWNAWEQFWRKSKGVSPPKTRSGSKEGWAFTTEYPPPSHGISEH